MKYLRVILAIPDDPDETDASGLTFTERLDCFIEDDVAIQGAYVSAPYDTRDDALSATWNG